MKAAPGTRVQIDTVRGEATLFPFRWHEPLTYTPAQAAAEYPALLESVVGYESRSQNEPAVTLSGGYDSNYLLYLLKSQNSHPTRAYCIGGSVGRNETAQAAQIACIYPDVRFRSALVDSDTLNHLPDIVWRLEGAVYERGVFLQYELSKLLSADGVTDILEGDGADQVMRENYQVIHQADLTRISHIWHQIPDYALKYIVLKKNMNMLASEGITPHYPYLDIRLLSCFHALRHENGTNKAFHKKIVESSVSKEVRSLLADVGGATQIRALAGRPDTEETKLEETIREQYLELFRRLFLGDLRMQYQGQAFCDLTLEECLQGGTAV